jgi:hypothetical protein
MSSRSLPSHVYTGPTTYLYDVTRSGNRKCRRESCIWLIDNKLNLNTTTGRLYMSMNHVNDRRRRREKVMLITNNVSGDEEY